MSSKRNSLQDIQPRTIKPRVTSLLSLPSRIFKPPPPAGNVRPWGVAPAVQVRLQDVLDRKHLPPLGLKDFEEWLLYVEHAPENLYFILWLREYTIKYNAWTAAHKSHRDGAGHATTSWSLPSSSQLAMFYARAKQTFFMPNSPYELNLPARTLEPFHSSDVSLHPDPAMFTNVAIEVQRMLEASLRLFVQAQLNNVGNRRAMCGIVAGIVMIILFAFPPLLACFLLHIERWYRLLAFPGMWLGLTITLAAFNGICMGVYIFGDLRQLHKFELARPPISRPRPLRTSWQRPPVPSLLSPSSPTSPTSPTSTLLQINIPPGLSIIPPPPAYVADHTPGRITPPASHRSSQSSSSCSSDSSGVSIAAEAVIHISPALYEADPIDGPATSPAVTDATFPFSEKVGDNNDSFTTTATFIHPYDPLYNDDYDYLDEKPLPEEGQPLSPFDFDALPVRPNQAVRVAVDGKEISPSGTQTHQKKLLTPRQYLERMQSKCSPKWRIASTDPPRTTVVADLIIPTESRTSSFCAPQMQADDCCCSRTMRFGGKKEVAVRRQWRMANAVPAFSQLTSVLSPVIARAHWEIVVKSIVTAFLLTATILGALLAIPPR